MVYSDLKKVYYSSKDRYEMEYKQRLYHPAAIKTNLYPRLMKRDEFASADYPLFVTPTLDLLMLLQKISDNSKRISQIADDLPPVAHQQFYNEQLYRSVISTNEIEGVKTSRAELEIAFENILLRKNQTGIRHLSTLRMYLNILGDHFLHITELEDIRAIYDQLTDGEISEEDFPDGELFRNKSTYIVDDHSGKTIHIPPRDESGIKKMLNDWLEFINNPDIPFLIKAIIGHYFFENIHPFYDGNGRTGRYILSMYLSRRLDKFSGLILSQEVHRNKNKYYKSFASLGDVLNRADATNFVVDILEMIFEGQNLIIEVLTEKKEILERALEHLQTDGKLSDSDRFVLTLLVQSKLFVDKSMEGLKDNDIKELARKSEFSWRSIKKSLDHLRECGKLMQVSQRPLIHEINDDYFADLSKEV